MSLAHITYLCYREQAFELREVRIRILTILITVSVRLRSGAELSVELLMGGRLHDQTKVVTLDSGCSPIL